MSAVSNPSVSAGSIEVSYSPSVSAGAYLRGLNIPMNRLTLLFATLFVATNAAFAQPEPPPPAPPAPPRPSRVRVSVNSPAASFLGVGVTDIDAERTKALKLKEEHGVEVSSVDADSP